MPMKLVKLIVYNKWDLVDKDEKQLNNLNILIMPVLLHFVKTGQRVDQIFPLIQENKTQTSV